MDDRKGISIAWMTDGEGRVTALRLFGLPQGLPVRPEAIEAQVHRFLPGYAPWTANRKIPEGFAIESGLSDGFTTGDPLTLVRTDPFEDSDPLSIPRPGTADLCALAAGLFPGSDGYYGDTALLLLTAAGAVAQEILQSYGITVGAHIASVGLIRDHLLDAMAVTAGELSDLKDKAFPVLDDARGMQMIQRILREKAAGNSVGGVIEAAALGLPRGLGGPYLASLKSRAAQYLMALPAVCALEFGAGFAAASLTGSQHNDPFVWQEGIDLSSNRSGGTLGGMATGLPFIVRLAFKPTPGIAVEQDSFDPSTGERVVLLGRMEDDNRPRGRHEKPLEPVPEKDVSPRGRHEAPAQDHVAEPTDEYFDLKTGQTVRIREVGTAVEPCVVPRAVPVVEGALSIALLDCCLRKENGHGLG